jgi:uncharacterized membrane protein
MYSKVSAQIAQTFKNSFLGFVMLIWHAVLQVPMWITIGLPVLAVVLFAVWLWYNFLR